MGETTYTPVRDYFKTRNGKAMGADHPIAWTHEPATGSRFFYTAFDHDLRTLKHPLRVPAYPEAIKFEGKGTAVRAKQPP